MVLHGDSRAGFAGSSGAPRASRSGGEGGHEGREEVEQSVEKEQEQGRAVPKEALGPLGSHRPGDGPPPPPPPPLPPRLVGAGTGAGGVVLRIPVAFGDLELVRHVGLALAAHEAAGKAGFGGGWGGGGA